MSNNEEEIYEECAPKEEIPDVDQTKETQQEKTAEEIESIKDQVIKLKLEANNDYTSGDYLNALNKYTVCINMAKDVDFKEQLAIINCNKAQCFLKMNDEAKALEHFNKAIEYDNKYVKAYVNRMLIYKNKEDYLEALEDFNKIKELSPKVYSDYRYMEKELNYKAELKKKQMTDEMLTKLKDVGNSFLGLFGMSTNNFNLVQNESGGYSIQYKN